MSLMIGTPAYGGQCTSLYLQSMIAFSEAASARGLDTELFLVNNEAVIQRARHRIAHAFFKSPHSHLLFIDADMGFRPEDVFAMLDAKKDIVAGVGPQKRIDWSRIANATAADTHIPLDKLRRMGAHLALNLRPGQVHAPVDEQDCIEVIDVGTGFMLVAREVVEALRARHPELMFLGDTHDRGEEVCAMFETMIDGGRYLTEDFSFCRRWERLGGKVHVYVSAQLKHVGTYTYEGNLSDQMRDLSDRPPELSLRVTRSI